MRDLTTNAASSGTAAPVVVRLAGLPTSAMEALASPQCRGLGDSVLELESQLATARQRMVDRLHERIPGAPPEARRALLGAKRDCFNGRHLGKRRTSSDWPVIHGVDPALADEICDLEERLETSRADLAKTFAEERDRERRSLVELLADENLMRGMALATPVAFGNLGRLRKSPEAYRRKERKLEQTLLRYASRAAMKLSPFSTLTRVGLGLVKDLPQDDSAVILTPGAYQTRLLRRVKKEMVNRYLTMLAMDPTFRGRLQVGLNSTVEQPEPGIFRFFRAPLLSFDRDKASFTQRQGSVVSVKLSGEVIDSLRQALTAEHRSFGDLASSLADVHETPVDDVKKLLDALIGLGFLELRTPWASLDSDPEQRLLEFLRTFPSEPVATELGAVLEETLEQRQADVDSRGLRGNLARIAASSSRGFESLGRALEVSETIAENNDRSVHEDVFLESGHRDARGAMAEISRASADEALANARPILHYSDFNCIRWELLLTLRGLAVERWPGRRQVGLLELLQASKKVWRDYLQSAAAAVRESRQEPWNPLGLGEIDALQGLRRDVNRSMAAVLKPDGDDFVIDPDAAEAAVGQIPRRYRSPFDPSLFVQPAGEGRWMLNHLLDGTGRFSTRYTTVMSPEMREFWTAHYRNRGHVGTAAETAELVDVLCAHDDHLNVHAVQTSRVLEVPGEDSGLPKARRLELSDLRVGLDEPLPYLMDASGERVLPIFLGATSLVHMPILVQVVSLFGLAEFRLLHPRRRTVTRGDTTYAGRLRIGNLILRRRRWAVSPHQAFGDFSRISDPEFFLKIHRWRRSQELPARVFVTEKLETSFGLWDVFKPQYIDLTSPSFVPLMRTALESAEDELKFEEMLPMPESFPADARGERWAFEVQLEPISLSKSGAESLVSSSPVASEDGREMAPGAGTGSATTESSLERGARRGSLIHKPSLTAHPKGERHV